MLVVVAGVLLHNSVDATVRMAANLGFTTWLVADATASVDVTDLTGRRWPAEDVQALSLALLSGEYAEVVEAAAVLGSEERRGGKECVSTWKSWGAPEQ